MKMHFSWTPFAAASLVLLLGAATGEAQTTYFGEDLDGSQLVASSFTNSLAAEALFLSSLIGVGTETFDGFALNTTNPSLSFPGAGTAQLTGTGCVSNITQSACSNPVDASTPGGTNGFGRYPVSSPNYFEVNAGDFVIDFSAPVAAFGFFGVDIGEFGGTLGVNFFNGATLVAAPTLAYTPSDGNAFFFGFIDAANPFTRVTFNIGGSSGDVFAFDNMTIGSVEQVVPQVPEPASMLLMLSGLLGSRHCRGPASEARQRLTARLTDGGGSVAGPAREARARRRDWCSAPCPPILRLAFHTEAAEPSHRSRRLHP